VAAEIWFDKRTTDCGVGVLSMPTRPSLTEDSRATDSGYKTFESGRG